MKGFVFIVFVEWQVHTPLAWLDAQLSGHVSTTTPPPLMLCLPNHCRENAQNLAVITTLQILITKLQPILTTCTTRTWWKIKVFFIQTRLYIMEALLILWLENMQQTLMHSLMTLPKVWSSWEKSNLSQEAKVRSESIAEKSISWWMN